MINLTLVVGLLALGLAIKLAITKDKTCKVVRAGKNILFYDA